MAKKDSPIKSIPATLELFGYSGTPKPWFISNGAGIVAYPEEPFRADYFLYALCMGGKASLLRNNEKIAIRSGTFFTAIPSTILQVLGHTKNFKAKIIVFERSFLLKNILDARQLEHLGFFNYQSLAQEQFTEEEVRGLGSLLDYIYRRSFKEGVFQNEIMQSLVFNVLFETADIYTKYYHQKKSPGITRQEELFLQFMKLVQLHFASQEPLSFYSQKLFISEKYLIQLCKNISGKTPGAILAEAMINEAKLLLNNPDNNITLVSQQLNYATVAAFSKFFKKNTGIAPKEWGA